jgi:hypothetical protein
MMENWTERTRFREASGRQCHQTRRPIIPKISSIFGVHAIWMERSEEFNRNKSKKVWNIR